MKSTVVITTKNRKDELRVALRSALDQTVHPEIVVIDDGSTDGTAELVRTEFPQARLIRHEKSRSYIVRRNEAAQLASAPVVFSIDDDAAFSSPRVIEKTLAEFDHPRVGAVAIPCVDVREDQMFRQRAPHAPELFVTDSFIGTAHAVRRDVFLHVGGYRSDLIHQGEERDFCLRMLNLGWVVRLGRADPIHHFESPNRDFRRMDFYGRRNDILFTWHNVPLPYLPLHLCGTTINGIISAARAGRFPRMLSGIITGYGECVRRWHERRPVPGDIYRLSRKLKKAGPLPLGEIEPLLPPIVAAEDFAKRR